MIIHGPPSSASQTQKPINTTRNPPQSHSEIIALRSCPSSQLEPFTTMMAPSMCVSSLAGAMLHTSVGHAILSRGHAHTPQLAEEDLQKSHKPKHVPAPGDITSGMDYSFVPAPGNNNQRMLAHTSSFDTGKMHKSCLNCLRRVFGNLGDHVRYKMHNTNALRQGFSKCTSLRFTH